MDVGLDGRIEGVEMNITLEQLVECVSDASTEIEVAVRDDDYYAKRDSTTFTKISYICPHRLIEALQSLEG